MKAVILLLLQLSSLNTLAYALPPSEANEHVLFRAPETNLVEYYAFLKSHSQFITPQKWIEQKLQTDFIPENYELKLEAILTSNYKSESEQYRQLKAFYIKTLELKKTPATKRFQNLLLKRISEMTPTNDVKWIKTMNTQLETIQLDGDKELEEQYLKLSHMISWIKGQKGGEDFVLFINGQKVTEFTNVDFNKTYEWTLVSSLWAPYIFSGTFNEFLNNVTQIKSHLNWIRGSANDFRWNSFMLIKQTQRFILWEDLSVTKDSWSENALTHTSFDTAASKPSFLKRNRFLIAVLAGLATYQYMKVNQLEFAF